MSLDKLKNDLLDFDPLDKSNTNRSIINMDNKNILNKKTPRKIRLKPINLINFYKFDRNTNRNTKEINFENYTNFKILEDMIKNNNNKLLNINKDEDNKFNDNLKLNYLTNIRRINKNNINFIFHNQPKLTKKNRKKTNFLYLRNLQQIKSAKSNTIKRINYLSSDNLFLPNESNQKSEEKENILKPRKKIFSSKSKSSQDIFISNLNLKKERKSSGRRLKSSEKNYDKKWDLPKVINFDKITGRYKINRNPIKHKPFERMYNYSPNYDLISYNGNKAYVRIGKDDKTEFKNYKINITRKYLCNHLNIINNSGDFYNIFKIIKEQKQKEEKRRVQKEKNINILEQYKYYINQNNFRTIDY